MRIKVWAAGIFVLLLLLPSFRALADEAVLVSCQMPYYLGRPRSSIQPGETVQALVTVEKRGGPAESRTVSIELPPGWLPAVAEEWDKSQNNGQFRLQRQIELEAGYGHWFDLLRVKAPETLLPGDYYVAVEAGGQASRIKLPVTAGESVQGGAIRIEDIVLPLDRDGKPDERLEQGTLVLRDRQWDYYKNVLAGKGASNQEVEAIHPVTHIGVDVANPSGDQKLELVTIDLLDAHTRQPVAGLFTPGTTGEDLNAGALDGHRSRLMVFTALNGEARQRLLLPVYTDERLIGDGQYSLRVTLDEGAGNPVVRDVPFQIIKKDEKAAGVVGLAVVLLTTGMLLSVRRIRPILSGMKTRWLVTIALFGACAFAVVNVPATLLTDFFHILLGPFGFLVSGLFNGVFLYMIVVTLILLIPRPGVIAMMTLVRMLLGMLAFGQISPITLLSYGMHAFLLETFLAAGGVYRWLQTADEDKAVPGRMVCMIGLACGLADMIASYVGLQAMAFLYRLYYADWYIWLLMAVNGFLYTTVGAVSGIRLGRRLAGVGGD